MSLIPPTTNFVQVIANPAAGQDMSVNPSGGGVAGTQFYGRLLSIEGTFQTSATVANRLPSLLILDGSFHTVFKLPASSVQAASLTETYVWGVGLPFASGNNQNLIPIPPGLFPNATWFIQTSTAAIQAADAWTNLVITYSTS